MSKSNSLNIMLQKNKDLNNILYSLNNKNYQTYIDKLKYSDLLFNHENSSFFFQSILFAIGSKPTGIDLLINVILDFQKISSIFNQSLTIQSFFIVFKAFQNMGFFDASYPLSYTAYKLFKAEIFPLYDCLHGLLNHIDSLKIISKKESIFPISYFIWFFPEILQSFNSNEIQKLQLFCSKKFGCSLIQVIIHFLKKFLSLYQMHYQIEADLGLTSESLNDILHFDTKKFVKQRETVDSFSPLYIAIKTDDLDKLKQIIQETEDFDYLQVFEVSIYEYHAPLVPFSLTQNSYLTLLEPALFFGSKKCANFLSQFIEFDDEKAKLRYELLNGTYQAKNLNKLPKKLYQSFTELCIQYHQHILLSKILEKNFSNFDMNSLFWYCLTSNNTGACSILLNNCFQPDFFADFKGKQFKFYLNGIIEDENTTMRTLTQQMLFNLFSNNVKKYILTKEKIKKRQKTAKRENLKQIMIGVFIVIVIFALGIFINKIYQYREQSHYSHNNTPDSDYNTFPPFDDFLEEDEFDAFEL